MTNTVTQTNNTVLPASIKKAISKIRFYSEDDFIKDAKVYIDAIKNRRMLCIIKSVSKSGMSRTIKFSSYEKNYYRNYICLFLALGYKESRSQEGFIINGCGMDMVFHTNYTIIHKLYNIGIINKKECEELAQMTPTIL